MARTGSYRRHVSVPPILPSCAAASPSRQTYAIPSPVAPPVASRRRRVALVGSAWLLARGGPGRYGVGRAARRVAGRVAARLRARQPPHGRARRRASPRRSTGADARPRSGSNGNRRALPVRLVAEQRFALDGGRGGPTVGVIAGSGPADVAPRHPPRSLRPGRRDRARRRSKASSTRSARVTHPLGKRRRRARRSRRRRLGQRATRRRAARYRPVDRRRAAGRAASRSACRSTGAQRIAGDARPGSGPALSLGSDF